jgi:hypothetical protein
MNSDFPIVATLMQLQTALVGLPQPLIDQMHAAGPVQSVDRYPTQLTYS